MRFTTVILAVLASVVAAGPLMHGGFDHESSAALDVRDPAILSFGTSPGCGADCPVCGDESCVCGNANDPTKRACCNGYESTAQNLPDCVKDPS